MNKVLDPIVAFSVKVVTLSLVSRQQSIQIQARIVYRLGITAAISRMHPNRGQLGGFMIVMAQRYRFGMGYTRLSSSIKPCFRQFIQRLIDSRIVRPD